MEREYAASDEVREALFGVLGRVVDECRFGERLLDPDDVQTLVECWCRLNDGFTSTEMRARTLRR